MMFIGLTGTMACTALKYTEMHTGLHLTRHTAYCVTFVNAIMCRTKLGRCFSKDKGRRLLQQKADRAVLCNFQSIRGCEQSN